MKKLTTLLSFLIVQFIFAQPPSIDWQHCYGGTVYDFGKKIIPGYNNTLWMCGSTTSSDGDIIFTSQGYDMAIFKIDSSGNILHAGGVGGTGYEGFNDGIWALNRFTFVGSTSSAIYPNYHGGADIYVSSTYNSGNPVWQKCFGGSGDDYPQAIIQTYDSCYLIVGGTESSDGDVTFNHGDRDFWLIKIDQAGNLVWQKTYGGSYFDDALGVTMTTDHGFLITGYSSSIDGDVTGNHGAADFWVVKTDSAGTLEWQHSYGGSGLEVGHAGIEYDNSYYIIGTNNSNDGDVTGNHLDSSIVPTVSLDAWLLKLDINGNLIWQKSLGGGRDELGKSIVVMGNNLLLGCQSSSYDGDVSNNHGQTDFWILLLDTTGNILLQNCYGGSGVEELDGICLTNQNIYMTGRTESNDYDVSGNHGLFDFWLVKLNADSLLNSVMQEHNNLFCVFPNPVASFLRIAIPKKIDEAEIYFYNATGVLKKKVHISDLLNTEIELSDFHSGIYSIQIASSKNIIYSKKILVIH